MESRREKLILELMATRHMLRGSFKKSYSRCGKAGCWCQEAEKGHPRDRISWRWETKYFSQTIPKDDVPWAKDVTTTYKRFRELRKQLLEINEELRLLLNALEEELVGKTKKLKDYL